jgi:hypothetical protein
VAGSVIVFTSEVDGEVEYAFILATLGPHLSAEDPAQLLAEVQTYAVIGVE